jgi:hypothetical protein
MAAMASICTPRVADEFLVRRTRRLATSVHCNMQVAATLATALRNDARDGDVTGVDRERL